MIHESVLNGCLLQSHKEAGIELYTPDDHIVVLRCKGEVIATYSATSATISEIRKDATDWWYKNNKEVI